MTSSRVKYKIEVYDITAASGYKSASSALVYVNDDNSAIAVTDSHCTDYFLDNKYNHDNLPAADSGIALTAEDLSTVFVKKTFADVNAAKTAIISSNLATAISTNCSTVAYTLTTNNLILDCIHADDTKNSNMRNAIDANGWSSELGAVYSTIA